MGLSKKDALRKAYMKGYQDGKASGGRWMRPETVCVEILREMDS